MNETIQKIEEVFDVEIPTKERYSTKGDGYRITTDQQEILALIGNGQNCCEEWGYLLTESETDKFIGANLLSIDLTGTNRVKETIDALEDAANYGDALFVDFATSEGVLQFAAYNSHNGYYGHRVYLGSNQINHTDYL